MNQQQFIRARDLFEQLLEEGPPDDPEWLQRQVDVDEHVRAEVLALARCHSGAGAFLDTPAAGRLPDLLSARPSIAPGTSVGPYTIQRELGRGGMGCVYLAMDGRLGRPVALKALAGRIGDDASQRERLRREAKAAALLAHPGICTVYALEEIDGELYIASEFVEGRTLRAEIAEGHRPSRTELDRAAHELASALAAAHAKRITHRDLKPENVMRAADGHLKILDFGLARLDEGLTDSPAPYVTQPGAIVGTPAYMAPEQLDGRPVDARADVFALGVVLYEYASGTHPFQAPTALALAARVLEGEVQAIERVSPNVSRPLARVIEKCLRKAPSDRFATAAEVVTALARDDRPSDPAASVRSWWRGHQLAAILLYFISCVVGWQVKEWRHGFTDGIFLLLGVAATVGGVFRGHLVFTEVMNRAWMAVESRRASAVLLGVDLLIAGALMADGLAVASKRPLFAVLTFGLSVGIALARLVLEPATTRGAFDSY